MARTTGAVPKVPQQGGHASPHIQKPSTSSAPAAKQGAKVEPRQTAQTARNSGHHRSGIGGSKRTNTR